MTDKMTVFENDELKLRVDVDRVTDIDVLEQAMDAIHEEIEIKYFYEGGATILIGSEPVVIGAGDVLVINPYELHSTIGFGEQKGRYHLFMVGLDFFEECGVSSLNLRHLLTGQKLCFPHLIRGNEVLGSILSRAAGEARKKDEHYLLVLQGLLLEFFALLLREYAMVTREGNAWDKNLQYYRVIEPALQRIRNEYDRKLSVDELAELCNVSKYHFCRIFKQVTDQTVVEYVNDYRLSVADLLLEHTSQSVAQIAKNCGFEDESYFCRCYRKRRGTSPNQKRARLS